MSAHLLVGSPTWPQPQHTHARPSRCCDLPSAVASASSSSTRHPPPPHVICCLRPRTIRAVPDAGPCAMLHTQRLPNDRLIRMDIWANMPIKASFRSLPSNASSMHTRGWHPCHSHGASKISNKQFQRALQTRIPSSTSMPAPSAGGSSRQPCPQLQPREPPSSNASSKHRRGWHACHSRCAEN